MAAGSARKGAERSSPKHWSGERSVAQKVGVNQLPLRSRLQACSHLGRPSAESMCDLIKTGGSRSCLMSSLCEDGNLLQTPETQGQQGLP